MTPSPTNFLPAPQLGRAVFDRTGTRIAFDFDIPTDRAGIVGIFGCEALLTVTVLSPDLEGVMDLADPAFVAQAASAGMTVGGFALRGLLGEGAFCSFFSSRGFSLTLGFGALLPVGQQIDLLGGKIRRETGRSFVSSGEYFTEVPDDAPPPVANVRFPQELGLCDDLLLDASASTGGAGRPLRLRWELKAVTGIQAGDGSAGAVELGQALAAATADSSVLVSFPRSKLQAGATYTINVIVTNFYLLSSSLEEQQQLATIRVSGTALPVVEVLGGTRKQSVRSRALALSASGLAPACNSGDIIPLSFTWQQQSGPSSVTLVASSDPRRVTVPAGAMFPATQPYAFTVTASVVGSDPPVSTSSTVTVRIQPQSMAALIDGGDRSVGVTAPLFLSAANTQDPDIAPNAEGVSSIPAGATHVYTYEWDCEIAGSDISCDDLLVAATPAAGFASAAAAPSFTIPQANLVPYEELEVDFSVAVRSVLVQGLDVSTKEAEATVRITVLPGAVPAVSIQPPDNSLLVALEGAAGYRVDVTRRLILRGSAELSDGQRRLLSSTGSSEALAYKWRMVDGDFDLSTPDVYFSTPSDQPVFAVRAGAMTPGSLYIFELVVAPQSNLLLQGRSVVYVQANRSPSSGSIESSRQEGKALVDSFNFRATRWVDDPEDEPFRYSFWVHSGGAVPTAQQLVQQSFGTPLGAQTELNSLSTTLPASTAADGFVTVVTYVADAIGSTSSAFMRVKVLPPLADDADESAAVDLVRSETARLDRVLAEGSGEAAMSAVTSLASLLNTATAGRRRRQLLSLPSAPVHFSVGLREDDPFLVAASQAAWRAASWGHRPHSPWATARLDRLLAAVPRHLQEGATTEQMDARGAMLDAVVRASSSTQFDATSKSLALGSVEAITGVPEQLSSGAANKSLGVVEQLIGASFSSPRPADGSTQVDSLTTSTAQGVLNVLVNSLQAQEADVRRRLVLARARALAQLPQPHSKNLQQHVDAALLRALAAEQCSASSEQLGSRVIESAASGLAAGMLPSEAAQSVQSIDAAAPLCGPEQRQGAAVITQVLPLSGTDPLALDLAGTAAEVAPAALTNCGVALEPFGAAAGGDQTASRTSGLVLPAGALAGAGTATTLQVAELRQNPFCAELPGELTGTGAAAALLQPSGAPTQGSFVTDAHLKGPSSSDLIPFEGSSRPLEPVLVHLALTNVPDGVGDAPLVLPRDEEAAVRQRALSQDAVQSYHSALVHGLGAQWKDPRGAVLRLAGGTLAGLGRLLSGTSHPRSPEAPSSVHLHFTPRQAGIAKALQRPRTAEALAAIAVRSNSTRRLSALEDTFDADAAAGDLQRLVECPDNSTAQEGGSPYADGVYSVFVQCPTSVEEVQCLESSGTGNISYTCPLQVFTAGCVWYNPRTAQWDTEGCVMAALTNTHMTCACDHLTSFSARFSRLASSASSDFTAGLSRLSAGGGGGNSGAGGGGGGTSNGTDIGSNDGVLGGDELLPVTSSPYVLAVVSTIALLYLLLLAGANFMDASQTRAFLKALGRDEEVALLRHLNSLAGRPFKLASHMDASAEAALLRAAANEQQQLESRHSADGEGGGVLAAQERVRDACPYGLGGVAPQCLVACLARSNALQQQAPRGTRDSSHSQFIGRLTATFRGVALSDAPLGKGSMDEHLTMSSNWKGSSEALQSAKVAMDRAATSSDESFELFRRLWQMRWFAARTAWLRIVYNHRVWSLFSRFDHRLSRSKRTTVLFGSVLSGLAAAAPLFGVRGVVEGQEITLMEVLVFALVALAIQLPLTLVIATCLSWASAAEFANTYTDLHFELHRRRTIEQQEANAATKSDLSKLQSFEPEASVPMLTRSARASAAGRPARPPPAGGSAAHDTVQVPEWEPANQAMGTGERAALLAVAPQVVPLQQLRWEVEVCDSTRISCALSKCNPRVAGLFSAPEHPDDSDVDTDDELKYGWLDAPLTCTRVAPWCVRSCGRHPEQRATWLRQAREADFEPWGCCWVGSNATPHRTSIEDQRTLLQAASAGSDGGFNARASQRRLHARRAARLGRMTLADTASEADSLGDDVLAAVLNPALLIISTLQRLAVRCACNRRAVVGLATPATPAYKAQWAAAALKRLQAEGADKSNAAEPGCCARCMATPDTVEPGMPAWWCGCLHHVCPNILARGCLMVGCCVTLWSPGRPVSMLRGWETAIAWLTVLALVGMMLFYVLLFGLARGDDVLLSFLEAFGLSQVMALLVMQPAMIFLGVVWCFVVAPVMRHYLAWVPLVGSLLSPGGSAATGSGASLSGRLQNVSMVHASGHASGLSPDEALLAFSDIGAISAAMSAGGTAWRRRQEARALGVAHRLAKAGDDSLLRQLQSLSELQVLQPQAEPALGTAAFSGVSASADAGQPPGGDAVQLVASSRAGGGGAAAGANTPTDGRAGALVLAAPRLDTGTTLNAGMPSKHAAASAAPTHMSAGPGLLQRKVAGGTDYSKITPAATASLVLSGKAPAPDSTAEMRQQLHLVQVYLHKVFPRQAMADAVARFNMASKQGMQRDQAAVYNRTRVLSDDVVAQSTFRVSFHARRRWVRLARMASSGVLRQRMSINQQLQRMGMLPKVHASSDGVSPSNARRQRRLDLMQQALQAGDAHDAPPVQSDVPAQVAAAPDMSAEAQVQRIPQGHGATVPSDGAVAAEAFTVPAVRGGGPTFIVQAVESRVARRTHGRSVSAQPSRSGWQQHATHITVDILAQAADGGGGGRGGGGKRAASATRRRTAVVKVPDAVAAAAHLEPADWEGMRNMRFEHELGASLAPAAELASPRAARVTAAATTADPRLAGAIRWNASSRRVVFLQPKPAQAAEAAGAAATRGTAPGSLSPLQGAEVGDSHRNKVRDMYTVRETRQHSVQLASPRVSLSVAMPPVGAAPVNEAAKRGPAPETRLMPAQEVRTPSRIVRALDLASNDADAAPSAAPRRLALLGVSAEPASPWSERYATRGAATHGMTVRPQEISARRIHTVRATRMGNGALSLQIPTASAGRITVVLPPGAVAAQPKTMHATRSKQPPPRLTVVGEVSGGCRTGIRSLQVLQEVEHSVAGKRIAHLLPPKATPAGAAPSYPASRASGSELQLLPPAAPAEVVGGKPSRGGPVSLRSVLSSRRGTSSRMRLHLVLESIPVFKGANAFTAPAVRGEGPPDLLTPTRESSTASASRGEENLRAVQPAHVEEQIAPIAPLSSAAGGGVRVHSGPPTAGMSPPRTSRGLRSQPSSASGSRRRLSIDWDSDDESE